MVRLFHAPRSSSKKSLSHRFFLVGTVLTLFLLGWLRLVLLDTRAEENSPLWVSHLEAFAANRSSSQRPRYRKLNCSAYGGPLEEEAAQEMVYWQGTSLFECESFYTIIVYDMYMRFLGHSLTIVARCFKK